MGIPEGEGLEEIFETIMTENFPKLMSDTNPKTHEIQATPRRINAKKTTPRNIIFKLQIKDKGKIQKEAGGKNIFLIEV